MLTLRETVPVGLTDAQYDQFDAEESMQILAYYRNGDLSSLIEKKAAGLKMTPRHAAKIFCCRELFDHPFLPILFQ